MRIQYIHLTGGRNKKKGGRDAHRGVKASSRVESRQPINDNENLGCVSIRLVLHLSFSFAP